MKKKQLSKEEYDKLCKEFEETKMYDGRGEYSGYRCEKCGYIVATYYKDKGVTPFVIQCPNCKGTAQHVITTSESPPDRYNISKVKNWVRPAYEQFIKLSPASQEHVMNGGLVFEGEDEDNG